MSDVRMVGPWLDSRPGDEMLKVGSEFERDGITFRIERGDRCAGDKVISIKTNGWVRPRMSLLFILFRFKGGVEENNYGDKGMVKRGAGWKYLLWRIYDISIQGWTWAAERTAQEVKDRDGA